MGEKMPSWLAPNGYGYLNSLDDAGWLNVLRKCCRKLEDAQSRADGQPTFVEEWGEILGADVNALPAFIGPPVVEVVDSADLSTLHTLEKPALLLKVYLRATDSVILKEFKRVLSEQRKLHPSPAKKRGPTALNGQFDEFIFTQWISKKIVPLADLIEWRSREGAEAKDADFGRWLFPNRNEDVYKLVHRARQALFEAINLIPALTLQVEGARAAGASSKLPRH